MKKLLKETLELYLQHTKRMLYGVGSSEIEGICISRILENLVDFEAPDAYSIVEETLFLLELFQFDRTTKIRKQGSTSEKGLADANKAFGKADDGTYVYPIGDKKIIDGSTVYAAGNSEDASKRYVKNFLDVATAHYNKIETYLQNIAKENIGSNCTTAKIGFFVEDKTISGNFYYDNQMKKQPIFLFETKQFLDFFSKNDKLEFFLCGSTQSRRFYLHFISRDTIKDYRKKQVDMNEIKIYEFTAMKIGAKVIF